MDPYLNLEPASKMNVVNKVNVVKKRKLQCSPPKLLKSKVG